MVLGLALAGSYRKTAMTQGTQTDYDVAIVGGGLAGLTAAIALSQAGRRVLLAEKKTYPYHKVCGEYISNEVLGYLRSLGFDPFAFGAASITRLRISTPRGKSIYPHLGMGGFALSRYVVDDKLAQLAQQKGADVRTGTRITDIRFQDERFTLFTANGTLCTAKLVIGSWGKRETLDKKLQRDFIEARTRYMGVKYHIRTDYPVNEIGLDNFDGGYCGIVKIEGDRYNLCNFYRRPKGDAHKSIRDYEEAVVFKNPIIKSLFINSEFLFEEPVVINEVSFAPKATVENHILMCGDSAGVITPLCGNGMSMAITAAKLLTDCIQQSGILNGHNVDSRTCAQLENTYTTLWKKQFSHRLFWGNTIQRFFGNPAITSLAINAIHAVPSLERKLINATHGKPLL